MVCAGAEPLWSLADDGDVTTDCRVLTVKLNYSSDAVVQVQCTRLAEKAVLINETNRNLTSKTWRLCDVISDNEQLNCTTEVLAPGECCERHHQAYAVIVEFQARSELYADKDCSQIIQLQTALERHVHA